MSWGGPSDEFRMYDNSDKIQYWFLDWFDGASIEVDDFEVVQLMNNEIERKSYEDKIKSFFP